MPMWIKLALAVAFPVAVFFGGAALLNTLSNRQPALERLKQATCPQDRKPLSQRLHYDRPALARYFSLLAGDDPKMPLLKTEQKFLELDLMFPFLYGFSLLAPGVWLWVSIGRPFSAGVVIAPVALTMLADWAENTLQLRELGRYLARGESGLEAGAIGAASVATLIKLACFGLSAVLLVVAVRSRQLRLP